MLIYQKSVSFISYYPNRFLNFEDLIFPALNGLQKINAPKHYSLLKRAYDMYVNQKDEFKNERNINLDKLDEEFYELEDLAPFRKRN